MFQYGYGSPDLDARGIHLRQYTRAFAFQGDDGTDVAVVVSEICMFTQALVDDVRTKQHITTTIS